jgi:hypothetical protein
MFVRKSTYEALKKINHMNEHENLELKNIVQRMKEQIEELKAEKESGKHKCDEYCEGCKWLVEVEGNPCYHTDIYNKLIEVKMETQKLCALDRKCKDYE